MSILDIFRSEKRKVVDSSPIDSSGDGPRMTNSGGVNYIDSHAYESRNINISEIAPIRTFDNMPRELAGMAYRNFSSWQNYAASVGTNNSLQQYSQHILNRLSYQECANLATDSMISKAVDVITRELFKSGGRWINSHLDIDNFEMILNSLHFYDKVRLAVQRALEYGGAFVYINTDDTDLSLPLYLNERTASTNKITGLTVIEPWQAAPVQVNSFNPLKENYMEPELWWVLGAGGTVHKTRLIPVVFYSVPDLIKPLYNYLGLPLSFYMKNYVSNADTVRQSISDLVLRFRTKIIKTTAQKIADPQTQARVKYMNATSNNLATLLLAKDEEWIETVTSLTGMDNLLSQMYELMTASTRGIPVTKLLGLSPRGFNATGEYDENNFYDVIDGYSQTVVVPVMERLAEYILCFKAGILSEPKYEFNPRKQIRPKEQAEINNLKADYISKLIMSGVIAGRDAIKAISEDNFKFDWIDVEDYKVPENPEVEKEIFNTWMDSYLDSSPTNQAQNDKVEDEWVMDKKDANGLEHDPETGQFASKGGSGKQKTKKTYQEMCGTAYKEYSGKPQEAIEHLLDIQNGYVPAAAHKDGIGDIDFLWGEPYGKDTKGYGFAHIIEEREIQGFDGTALIKRLPEVIEKGEVGKGYAGRKTITYNDSILVFEKNDNSNWLLTEYLLYDKMDEETRKKAKELKKKANKERTQLYEK